MSFTAARLDLGWKLAVSPYEHGQHHNEYWKIPHPGSFVTYKVKDQLEERGYATGSTMSPEWMRQSLIRCELGQPSYVSCSNEQLRGFIAARGIDSTKVISKRWKGTRKELIEFLDKADQETTFTKFMNLPAEMRNRIYTMYFAEFDMPLYAPVQPPLTLTSSQIRSETLQMFYDLCQFEVGFVCDRTMNYITSQPQIHLRPTQRTSFWLISLSPPSLAALRRLRFDIRSHDARYVRDHWRNDSNFAYGYLAWFELEILRGDENDELRVFFPHGPSNFRVHNLNRVRSAVARLVGRMNARREKVCLTMADLKAFRKAMEA